MSGPRWSAGEMTVWPANTYTAGDYGRALHAAIQSDDPAAMKVLQVHGPRAHHCNGWEVAFWPCPVAVCVLDDLFGGAA